MAQLVKDLALLQLWCRSKLWCSFNPWPGNFNMPLMWPKKKKKNNENHKEVFFFCFLLFYGITVAYVNSLSSGRIGAASA